jgi:hypothetical protein
VSDEELIAELLLIWEEQFTQGTDVPAEELCRDCPHLAGRVAEAIRELKAADWLRRPSGGGGASDSPHQEGDVIAGRYRLDARVGEGGFGVVWRGGDLKLRRVVAVKVSRRGWPAVAGRDSLLAEARRVAQLRHPGIIPVYDAGRDGQSYFIVSELIDGESLTDVLRRSSPTVREAVRIVREVAGILAYTHARGFIHRDLKPSNILLDRQRELYLADFATALTVDESALRGGSATGTLAYMAPEQWRADAPLDVRCDLYALGVILFELLTGQLPFAVPVDTEQRFERFLGPAATGRRPPAVPQAAALRAMVLGQSPPPPSALNPLVLPDLDAITLRCLAKSADERFATAADLVTALQRDSSPPTWGQARRAVLVAVGLAVLATLGVLAISPTENPYLAGRVGAWAAAFLLVSWVGLKAARGRTPTGYPLAPTGETVIGRPPSHATPWHVDWRQRRRWLEALVSQGAIPARDLGAVVNLLHSPDPEFRREVIEVLGRAGKPAVPWLIGGLCASQPDEAAFRRAAVLALGRVGSAARAAVPLLRHLEDDEWLRPCVRLALANLRPNVVFRVFDFLGGWAVFLLVWAVDRPWRRLTGVVLITVFGVILGAWLAGVLDVLWQSVTAPLVRALTR